MSNLIIILVVVVLLGAGGLLFYSIMKGEAVDASALMGRSKPKGNDPSSIRQRISDDESGDELTALRSKMQKSIKQRSKVTLEDRFFQAGLFYQKDREFFARLRVVAPVISVGGVTLVGFVLGLGADLFLVALIVGGLIGYQIPFSYLDRKTLRRADDILFYLPLVIEQMVVGVSASLDIAPCISTVIEMADERESHNPVTDLLKRAQFFMKQGVPMEEALTEIGKLSGHTELKHAFMSLAQVARHGGEVSRQLQELADSVQTQRETKIDAKIKKLELEATGPVAMVFAGFLIIILLEFGLQIFKAFE